jgi:transcriptional regulator GlxA family with amidase domain
VGNLNSQFSILNSQFSILNSQFSILNSPQGWRRQANFAWLWVEGSPFSKKRQKRFNFIRKGIMASNAGLCQRVKLFIDENFATVQSVAEIAEKFEVSPAWLTRAFRTQFNLGPKEYLDAIRIREAMKLLTKNQCRCYEVAQAVGLPDEDALGKLFKRQGLPAPTVLRQANGQVLAE